MPLVSVWCTACYALIESTETDLQCMQELKRGLEVLYGQEIVAADVVVWRRLPSPPVQESSSFITTASVCAGVVALLSLLISAIVLWFRRLSAKARMLETARASRGPAPKAGNLSSDLDYIPTEAAPSKQWLLGALHGWLCNRDGHFSSCASSATEPSKAVLREVLRPGDELLKRFVLIQLLEEMCTGELLVHMLILKCPFGRFRTTCGKALLIAHSHQQYGSRMFSTFIPSDGYCGLVSSVRPQAIG